MLGGLDRLQKELDALTYNSRSVMNAMIRSTVASGTEMGYTVQRVKDDPNGKITLTQPQIYKIFKFYREWENNSFDESWFDENAVDEALKEALANHSKILYMNQDNVGESTGYWLNLIKTANNPKLVTNSAPVPVNLRTPVFDENMATTTYGSNQTFVFPTGYYLMDILGYSSDGVEHSMGGKKWSIIADDDILLDGGHVAIGRRNASDSVKPAASGNGGNTTSFNIAMGSNVYTYGDYSIVGGSNSGISSLGDYALAIGDRVFADGHEAVVFGSDNIAVGNESIVAGGEHNIAVSDNSSVLGGENNIAGAEVYDFKLVEMTISAAQSNGANDYENCIAACNGYISSDPSISIATTTIYSLRVNGNISKALKEDDVIRMFDFTTKFGGRENIKRYELNGAYYPNKTATVTSVSYDSSTNVTTITTTGAKFESIIDGGKLAKIRTYDKYKRPIDCGMYSATVGGLGLLANGQYQVATGKYNYSTPSSIFSIGVGESEDNRASILDVGVDYFRICGSPWKAGQILPNNTYSESYTKEAGFVGFQVFTGNSHYISNYVEIVNKDSRIHASDGILEMVFNPKDASNKYGLSIESGCAVLSIDSPEDTSKLNTLELRASKTISIDNFSGLANVGPADIDILAEGNVNIGGLKGVNIQAGTANARGTVNITNANVVLNNSSFEQYASTQPSGWYSGFYALQGWDQYHQNDYFFEYRNILSDADYNSVNNQYNIKGVSIGYNPKKNYQTGFNVTSGFNWWERNAYLDIHDNGSSSYRRYLLTSDAEKEVLTATPDSGFIQIKGNVGTNSIGGVTSIKKIEYAQEEDVGDKWLISHRIGINSVGATAFAYGNIELYDLDGFNRGDYGISFKLSERASFVEKGIYHGACNIVGTGKDYRDVDLAVKTDIGEVGIEVDSYGNATITILWGDKFYRGSGDTRREILTISFNFPLKKWYSIL